MMGNNVATADGVISAGISGNCLSQYAKNTAHKSVHFFGGLAVLFAIWWLGIHFITQNPDLSQFKDFSPEAAFKALPDLWESGIIPAALETSGYRLGMGMKAQLRQAIQLGIRNVIQSRCPAQFPG